MIQNFRLEKKKSKVITSKLSFADDDLLGESETTTSSNNAPGGDDQPSKKSKISKNPHVETSFLPDKAREEQEMKERLKLAEEWKQKQEEVKSMQNNLWIDFSR